MFKEVIILAGGFGTRLQSVVNNVPKSMALVNGRPFLEYILDHLEFYSVKKVILATGYKHDMIEAHFGNKYKYLKLDYSIEEEPLGTGGAIKKALTLCESKKVLILNGDTLFKVNIGKLNDFMHVQRARCVIVLHEAEDVSRYGCVETDNRAVITRFVEKGKATGNGLINGGVYVVEKSLIDELQLPDKFSFEKDFIEKYYSEITIHGMVCKQYFLDIGIPEDYEKAQTDFTQFPQY